MSETVYAIKFPKYMFVFKEFEGKREEIRNAVGRREENPNLSALQILLILLNFYIKLYYYFPYRQRKPGQFSAPITLVF